MAWQNTLLEASYKGIPLDVLRDSLKVQNALSEHEYPYVDGADIEDMGQKARKISLPVIVFGNDYENRLQTLIATLDTRGPGELIHPVYGSIPNAQLEGYSVDHDADSIDSALLNLEFVISVPSQPFFDRELPEQLADKAADTSESTRWGGLDMLTNCIDNLQSTQSRLNSLSAVCTSTLSVLASQVNQVLTLGLSIADSPRAFLSDVRSILGRMCDMRRFDLGSIKSDIRDLGKDYKNVVQMPSKVNNNLVQAGDAPIIRQPAAAQDIKTIEAILNITVATELADTVADVLFDEGSEPELTPADIEEITAVARESIQTAIDSIRDLDEELPNTQAVVENLKNLALQLQEAAQAIINIRPPLIQKTVGVPGNLHLIAFRWYGDFERAGELLRLNPQIKHPSFILAGEVLNAYAR